MQATFRVEVSYSGFDLVSEPPLPPIEQRTIAARRERSKKPPITSRYIQERYGHEIGHPSSSSLHATSQASGVPGGDRAKQLQPHGQNFIQDACSSAIGSVDQSSLAAARFHAQEIEDAQERSKLSRELTHLSQLDARSHEQLSRVASHAQFPSSYSHYAGIQSGFLAQLSSSLPDLRMAMQNHQQHYSPYGYPANSGYALQGAYYGEPSFGSPGSSDGMTAYYYPQMTNQAQCSAAAASSTAGNTHLAPGSRAERSGFQQVAAASHNKRRGSKTRR